MRGRIGPRGGTCGPRICRRLQEDWDSSTKQAKFCRNTPTTDAGSFTELFERLGAEHE